MSSRLLSVTALVALGAACGQDVEPPAVRNFDRPTAMSFGCFGDMRVEADGSVVRTAQPLTACTGSVPEGQEGLASPPTLRALVLETSRGTVDVINVEDSITVIDSDPLSPGKNDIPLGSLPVGLVSDYSACYAVSANAGSCDLSSLDITSALDFSRAAVSRVPVLANGEVLRAKPRAIVAPPQTDEVGALCPDTAQGIAYVAYPSCDLVAAVDLATGEVVDGVVYGDDGTATRATTADFACPVECGDGVLARAAGGDLDAGTGDAGTGDAGTGDAGPGDDAGLPEGSLPGRPVTLAIHRNEGGGTRLFIGGEDSPILTIVGLDENDLPTGAIQHVVLEGDVGITSIDVTDRIEMGGDVGGLGATAGQFQFAYVITTDSTVRVVDLDRRLECDTQVDPRRLHDEIDYAFLSCMPVGDPATPRRRVGARSPGIHVPGHPTAVAFATIEAPEDFDTNLIDPYRPIGTFAFITSGNGAVWMVNVDDDNYPDREKAQDPLAVSMALAIPHQVRDALPGRHELSEGCAPPKLEDPNQQAFGARLDGPPTLSQPGVATRISNEKLHELPFLRGVICERTDVNGQVVETPVTELSYAAPQEIREASFPDLSSVLGEDWGLYWEGSISVDGPEARKALLSVADDAFTLEEGGGPYCAIGVEDYDVAVLVGCDPARGNSQCGVGEVCYVHPESPSAIRSGLCLPANDVDAQAAACREVLISRRHYTVKDVTADRLTLGERARSLRTTPLDGCVSDDQCQLLAEVDVELSLPDHPVDAMVDASEYQWSCQPDPSRAPGPDRCLMVCEADADCEQGYLCGDGGVCVAGTVPDPSCAASIQRYEIRAGEAFALVGSRTGFLHDQIRDPDTGECVTDPDASPLEIGRVPLRPPACDDDGDPLTGPNPCSTTIDHTEVHTPFATDGAVCQAQSAALRTRDAPAIEIRNPAFTFHLVDTETQGDAVCRNDQMGDLPPFGTVYFGYQILFTITGGFAPLNVLGVGAAYPIEIVAGPAGQMWVLDQGDDLSSSTSGRVYFFNPGTPGQASAFLL